MFFNSMGIPIYTVVMWSRLLHGGLNFLGISLCKLKEATYPPNAPSRTAKTPKSALQQLLHQIQWISGACVVKWIYGILGVGSNRKFQCSWGSPMIFVNLMDFWKIDCSVLLLVKNIQNQGHLVGLRRRWRNWSPMGDHMAHQNKETSPKMAHTIFIVHWVFLAHNVCNIHLVLLFIVINQKIGMFSPISLHSPTPWPHSSPLAALTSASRVRWQKLPSPAIHICWEPVGSCRAFCFWDTLWHTHFQMEGRNLHDSRFKREICDKMTRHSMIRIIRSRLWIYEMTSLHPVVLEYLPKKLQTPKFSFKDLAA